MSILTRFIFSLSTKKKGGGHDSLIVYSLFSDALNKLQL
jgi:hypothetical protein